MANCFTAVTGECILNSILRFFASFIHTQLLRAFSWWLVAQKVYRRVIHQVYSHNRMSETEWHSNQMRDSFHFSFRHSKSILCGWLFAYTWYWQTRQWSCVVRSPVNRFLVTHNSQHGLSFTLLFDTDLFMGIRSLSGWSAPEEIYHFMMKETRWQLFSFSIEINRISKSTHCLGGDYSAAFSLHGTYKIGMYHVFSFFSGI